MSLPSRSFHKYLKDIDLSPNTYLSVAKAVASENGYDPTRLSFSSNDIHKLEYVSPDGSVRRFGRVGYGDFIIWSWLELQGEVADGFAEKKRNVFQKSHTAMGKKFNITDKYSPNNLALNILW